MAFKKVVKETLKEVSLISLASVGVTALYALNADDPGFAPLIMVGQAALSTGAMWLSGQIKPRLIGISTHEVRENWGR